MKIAFLSHAHLGIRSDLPGGGGVTNELIKRILEEAGHSVDFLSYRYHGVPAGGPLNRLAAVHAWRNASYINEVAAGYDVVICESSVCHRIKHPRCINLFHFIIRGFLDYSGPGTIPALKRLKLALFARVERAEAQGKYNVAVSEFSKAILENEGVEVFRVIPNAVNTGAFSPDGAPRNDRCLYVGSFSHFGKGFDVLERLAARGVEIDCVCDHETGRHGGLNYLGPVAHDRLPEIYNRYRMVLYPSRFENCALVPIEAMACGVPVVISNVGGGAELRRAIPEFVVDGHDEAAVEEYLRRISLIEKDYEAFSQKARRYATEHHSLDRFRSDWLKLVEDVYAL